MSSERRQCIWGEARDEWDETTRGRRGGFGARQEETLRDFNVGNSSGSGSNAITEEEVKAVGTAM